MPINYEIKSQLAKLLATEDLIVENRNVETAQFDVERRILTLPMWKRASNDVYDMLVGHEVGHALYTPNDWSFEGKIPKQFVNVTEDARIEKLMKRRYSGISKTFYRGYKELSEDDFFGLEEEDLSKMNLADRVNLWFKIGNFVDIPIQRGEEMEIVNMISECETFSDVVLAAEVLYKYCKSEQQKVSDIETPNQKSGKGEDGMTHEEMIEEAEKREDENLESSSGGDSSSSVDSSNDTNEEPKVETDSTFSDGVQELNGNESSSDSVYFEVPKVNLEEIVISNNKVYSELQDFFTDQTTSKEYWDSYYEEYLWPKPTDYSIADNDYKKFKSSAQKEVNYLVKEFESKKSADSYSRATTARTGVLDCSKLHTYKYNEDLFKRVTTLADGKNHGLIFILDWSGSMSNTLLDTVKQLYNLIIFCNKVKIPFDVYAFTNNYIDENCSRYNKKWQDITYQEFGEYKLNIGRDMNLIHFFTSDVKKNELEKQMLYFWRLAYSNSCRGYYDIPSNYSLSGTPLNESIICLHEIIPQFQKKNKVQKVQCVILTDGEANSVPFFSPYTYNGVTEIGNHYPKIGSYLRNRKTGHTYQIEYEFYKFTEVLLKDLREKFPQVNFIGIRILTSSEFSKFIHRYESSISDDKYKKMKKEKFCNIKTSGYTSYFGMLNSSLNTDTNFDVEDGASKSKIKSAFIKNLKSKSMNKKVLNQFIDLIC